ncbi:SDR family oxidoreductase [Actinacidiphila oryziradicis]|uniref:SDR family oxidoreductase n=1 Tax=Actinacidiphila oryziradicis TaxID=2571141 RepID=A0A4U0RYG1_9ACTN|nr:SDR family oxidoreductase [Actinacidiphila oryziradicis]
MRSIPPACLRCRPLPVRRVMISESAAGRLGTAEDIAAAADFLTGPHPTFITGTDLLVDGGVVAAQRNGRVNLGQG